MGSVEITFPSEVELLSEAATLYEVKDTTVTLFVSEIIGSD